MSELPSSSREMRNRAEKQRRDKLNAYISELYTLVPSAASAPRKLDKTSTLRLSANFLRLHQNVDLRMKPYNRWSAMAGHLILEKLDSFLMAVSCTSGKIIYVSDRVEKLLGHAQVDMMGYQLSYFVHQADQEAIEKRLSGFAAQVGTQPQSTGAPAHDGQVYSFQCRLAGRQLSRGEPTVYESVAVSGTFRGPRNRRDWSDRYMKTGSGDKAVVSSQQQGDYSEPLFICVVRLLQTPNTLPPLTIMQAAQDEYLTHHTTTGIIIRTDHRIATIAGYMTAEVTGNSAYDYIMPEDLEYTLRAQSLMLSRGEGMVTYRLKTSVGRLIYLRSRGFIEYDQNTKEITSFFCINTKLEEEQGAKELQEMKNMLDKLNIGNAFAAMASSTPKAMESGGIVLAESSLQNSPSLLGSNCITPTASTSDCQLSNKERVRMSPISRASLTSSGGGSVAFSLCTSPTSDVQYSPSDSSQASSSYSEERCLSATPRSSLLSPIELPAITLSYGGSVPFPWHSPTDLIKLSATNAEPTYFLPQTKEVIISPDIQPSSVLGYRKNVSGTASASFEYKQDAVARSRNLVMHSSPSVNHQQLTAAAMNSQIQPATDYISSVVQSFPVSILTTNQVSQAHHNHEDKLFISAPSELNRDNYFNSYIIWPQRISGVTNDKTQKENLILNCVDPDKHDFKQTGVVNEQHFYHELKMNTTNSA